MKKVLIGMSGGVDSSATAAILQKQGYEVEGVTFLFTKDNEVDDAKRVCEQLGIKHHVEDYIDEFKEKIIDTFIDDYKKGLTPNPCVLCNKTMKIKLLYEKMLEYGCDYIATGHYAKIENGNLYVSEDLRKDQTYFMCEIPKEIIEKMILPLEGLTKEEVRKIAEDNNLVTAHKKDSIDICFIKEGFESFMEKNVESISGDVIDIETNRIIGKHTGLSHYTIGQRRGLNIGGTPERMFVVGKDTKKNILYIALGDKTDYLVSTSCIVEDVNLLCDKKITSCEARFRYKQQNINVTVNWIDDRTIEVSYENAKAVTPGQACVLYDGKQCLGGGIIKEVRKKGEKLWYLN